MRRVLCILICLYMVTVLPASGESLNKDVTDYTSGDYTYTLDDSNGAVITSYNGIASKLTVPSSLDGHPVKGIEAATIKSYKNLTSITLPEGLESIGKYAFFFCTNLTSITLPEGLKSIGDGAFDFCTNLASITLPDSLETMGSNPFSNCTTLARIFVAPDHNVFAQIDGILFNKAERKLISYPKGKTGESYIIPYGVKSIGDSAFSHCTNLTSITLPEGLESIGKYAFYFCTNLTSITLPEGLKSIGDSAFGLCSLGSITLPEGLKSIGDNAFNSCNFNIVTLPDSLETMGSNPFIDCIRLEEIWVEPNHPVFAQIDDVLFNKAEKKLISYPKRKKGKSYSIPTGIKSIGNGAFENCNTLSTITLPEGLKSIGERAFDSCKYLNSITLPEGLESIGESTFSYCENLESIIISDGVESVDERTFIGCKLLSSITLPASLTSIAKDAFDMGITLTVTRDSYSEQWAKENSFAYQYPDSADWLKN